MRLDNCYDDCVIFITIIVIPITASCAIILTAIVVADLIRIIVILINSIPAVIFISTINVITIITEKIYIHYPKEYRIDTNITNPFYSDYQACN